MTAITSTPLVTIATMTVVLSMILMASSIWGIILLLKDAKKHKKFAKVIRVILSILQSSIIIGEIVLFFMIANDSQSFINRVADIQKSQQIDIEFIRLAILLGSIYILYIISKIWGATLLFIQSKVDIKFSKRIRIICGILMIVGLLFPLFIQIMF